MAGVALVMGIAGILTSFLAIGAVPSSIGLVLSLMAKKKNAQQKAGLITSLVGLVLSVLFLVIYFRAVKNPGSDGILSKLPGLSGKNKGAQTAEAPSEYEIPEEFRAGGAGNVSDSLPPMREGTGTLDPREVFTEEMFDASYMPHREGAGGRISDRDFDEITDSPEIIPVEETEEGAVYVCRVEAAEGLAPFLFSYYDKYFGTAEEVHAIINAADGTTTRVSCEGGYLVAEVFSGAAGGAAEVSRIISGTPAESYRVYLDNGDIEKI